MGYSEVPCRLCGLSFNISRIRTASEPLLSGWSCTGDGRYIVCGSNHDRCKSADCYFHHRKGFEGFETPWFGSRAEQAELVDRGFCEMLGDEEGYVESEDEDWNEEDGGDSMDEGDVYEWESDEEVLDRVDREEDVEMGEDGEEEDEEEERRQRRKDLIYLQGKARLSHVEPKKDELIPLHAMAPDGFEDQRCEHIAGPSCSSEAGYNGHYISVEEMADCNTFQCLMYNDKGWRESGDAFDLPFERQDRRYALSGIGDCMSSRDVGNPTMTPARYGLEEMYIDCVVWQPDEHHPAAPDVPLPFHPSCFDIFLRQSRMRIASAGSEENLLPSIQRLRKWFETCSSHTQVYKHPSDEDVRKCSEQMYAHKRGTEYLAASPLFVPKLREIFKKAIDAGNADGFDVHNCAFRSDRSGGASPSSAMATDDPFCKPPMELRLQVLMHLSLNDIASLRGCSRGFTHIPVYFFRRRLLLDHPYLWEVRGDSNPPYLWTCIKPPQLKYHFMRKASLYQELRDIESVIGEEDLAMLPAVKQEGRRYIESLAHPLEMAQKRALESVIELPLRKTDWFLIYKEITKQWTTLHGLRNRRRVWKCMEEVMQQMDAIEE